MQLSKQICRLLDLYKFQYFHPANEAKRTPWERAAFKANGGRAGVPDLVILLQNGRTQFVELKTPQGRQSKDQEYFQQILESHGHSYVIWRSVDDALEFVKRARGRK
jgi:hypothetical protein